MAKAKAKAPVEGGLLVQLKDTDVSFVDPQTGWTLTRDEVKPWPENPGAFTRALKEKGKIIEVEAEVQAEPQA